ncbi:MAG: hypothetical protein K0S32_3020 [Bacteroidetes bacterium]|jgi:hypothetical protein|nr:hypothetical protein [Bacteroidota bacterium]
MTEMLITLIGRAGVMKLRSGKTVNYGGIAIEGDTFVYYTGKGLREMWPQDPNPEISEKTKMLRNMSREELIAGDYINVILISEIEAILS